MLQENRPLSIIRRLGELPLGVDNVENDDRVILKLDEHHVREFMDDELTGAWHPIAFADPLGERWERFNFTDNPTLHCGGGAGTGFLVVEGEYFLEVAQRLFGPTYPHR